MQASFLLSLLIIDLNLTFLLGSMMLLASFTILCSLMIVSLIAAVLLAARCGAIVFRMDLFPEAKQWHEDTALDLQTRHVKYVAGSNKYTLGSTDQ